MKWRLNILIVLLSFSTTLFALPPKQTLRIPPLMKTKYERRIYSFSVAGGFGFSMDKVDERHSDPARTGLAMTGMFRFHFFVTPNCHIQIGFENMSQKTKFNTYYFAEGHSLFYDGSFGYTHQVRTYELYMPIMGRVGFAGQEDNARSIFYLEGGYAVKTFLATTSVVTQNSTDKDIWGGTTELTFEHWLVSEQTSSVILIGMGLDKRIGWTNKFFSFELLYRYNFSRMRYTGNYNTNDLMFKNSCITFQVGYRFQ
jgi:hypothetical protein